MYKGRELINNSPWEGWAGMQNWLGGREDGGVRVRRCLLQFSRGDLFANKSVCEFIVLDRRVPQYPCRVNVIELYYANATVTFCVISDRHDRSRE